MSDKKLYEEKMKDELDEFRADIKKLKSRALMVGAETQFEISRRIKMLEGKIEEGKTKLSKLVAASESAWDSIRESMDSDWSMLKEAVGDAYVKIK